MISVPQANFLPDLEERTVRRTEISKGEAPSGRAGCSEYANDGVAPRNERVVAKDDITRFSADHGFGLAHMKYVADDTLDCTLADPGEPWRGGCSEKERSIF
jgi:hypothetical protein